MDKAPRWQRSPKWREAQDLAWEFRQLFYPRRFVPLRPLVIQAFRLFRAGFAAREVMQAMKEAAARGTRQVPQTLMFFIGWIRRLRFWKDRMLREATLRERRWEEEKRGLAAPRLWGAMANRDGPVGMRDLIAGMIPALEELNPVAG